MKKTFHFCFAASLAATLVSASAAVLYQNAGPFTVFGSDVTLPGFALSRSSTASDTLYFRYTVDRPQSNSGTENYYAAMEFYEGGTERLGIGNAWGPWAYSAFNTSSGNRDLNSATPEAGQTYQLVRAEDVTTVVWKVKFNSGADDSVTVWLNPDFSQPEANQAAALTTAFPANCTFNSMRLRCGGGGSGWTYTNVVIAGAATEIGFAAPVVATFDGPVPAPNAVSVDPATPLAITVLQGSTAVLTNTAKLYLDDLAQPITITQAGKAFTLTHQPAVPFAAGSTHTARAEITDALGSSFTNIWSFTIGYPALPVTLPGPYTVTGGGFGQTIFTTGDGWLSTNYSATSSRTLYYRFSMAFTAFSGADAGAGTYGGLHLYQGGTENLLLGNSWDSDVWGAWWIAADQGANGDGTMPLYPSTVIVPGEWHTIAARVQFTPGAAASVWVWLDPDFSQREDQQPIVTFFRKDTPFDAVRLRCGNDAASASFTNVIFAGTSTGIGFAPPLDPVVQNQTPADGSSHASAAGPISADIVPGSTPINTSSILLQLSGTTVTHTFTVTTNGVITVQYTPPTPLPAGSSQSCTLQFTDQNGTPYSSFWQFVIGYPTLPCALADPYYGVGGGGQGSTILNAQDWVGENYASDSERSLWVSFRIKFNDLNGEIGDGGGYGGLHLYEGNGERLLLGNTWLSTNWSFLGVSFTPDGGYDVQPPVPIALGEWVRLVAKIQFVAGADDVVSVWLNPDLSKSPCAQAVAPTVQRVNCTFDSIHLRAGNATANADFEDLRFAATPLDIGFATPEGTPVMDIRASGSDVVLSWSSCGAALEEAANLDGPWTVSTDQSNPQTRSAAGAARFFRLRR